MTHHCLKGPKNEIFGSRAFMQSVPVWAGDLGTRAKGGSFDGSVWEVAILYFSAYWHTTLNIFKRTSLVR
jgi:hypothetical protein